MSTTDRACNICGCPDFADYAKRTDAQCVSCRSLERHRVCFEVYRAEGLLDATTTTRRVLQFAPERITHDMLSDVPGTQYLSSDLFPDKYPHAQPLTLRLPEDLSIFPADFFDYLIHNHVWEHIPGSWVDHVEPFLRVLKPGGAMIFTFPYSVAFSPSTTLEGGEHLDSDEERIRVFGQHDHVRKFGLDFSATISSMNGCVLTTDGISDLHKQQIGGFIRDWGETVFLLRKTEQPAVNPEESGLDKTSVGSRADRPSLLRRVLRSGRSPSIG